ncbi:alanine--tRNA ligase [Candidatus Peribacteria bacterium]|nr:alanine--tRNA ligase [Candidatus Peribacteria bacterium]
MLHTTDSVRQLWNAFWTRKGHTIIPSASVLPADDPSALFHNSGMHPLVPYLNGAPHPTGSVRLANAQKCIRTIDLEEVGDATHLTFFEMLGNWSLGDYFKQEQIPWCYAFLTQELQLDPQRLAFSVFAGNDAAPRDEESAQLWRAQGVSQARIAYLGEDDNWWAKGDTGLCGPDTEMFYWKDSTTPAPENFQQTHDDDRWVEVWNSVFMTFNREEDRRLTPLAKKNIDTGAGLERLVAVLNGKTSVYETDAFSGILTQLARTCGREDLLQAVTAETDDHYSLRILADHTRTAAVLVADGVTPSNTAQGYILRRILRRASRHGRKLGLTEPFIARILPAVSEKLGPVYPDISEQLEHLQTVVDKEERLFLQTLERGEKEFLKRLPELQGVVDGPTAFHLYETYGYPLELTQEMAAEHGLSVDTAGFAMAEEAHRELSRTASVGQFSGGLADNDPETIKLHTTTHLLQEGLRQVLGPHVQQTGQHITPERTRFDFTHNEKLTPEEIAAVETWVNDAIAAACPITMEEMPLEQAYAQGALGWFRDKYGAVVRVYFMGPWSTEICGGPHLSNTAQVGGRFRIAKEESSGAGKRRIKGVIVLEES